jgi:hypothetical protein
MGTPFYKNQQIAENPAMGVILTLLYESSVKEVKISFLPFYNII